jgi:hypothetical protein
VIGLPGLHAMDRAQGARIWMASEATDMRCGFDRLAGRANVSDWGEPAKWPSVRVSLASRRSAEDFAKGVLLFLQKRGKGR